MKIKYIDDTQVVKFNETRIEKAGQKLSKDSMKRELENLGFHTNQGRLSEMIKLGIIEKHRKGRKYAYSFTYSPVYKEKFHTWQDNCAKMWRKNQKADKEISVDKIQQAIDLLKQNGYTIYKRVITETFEEV